MLVSHQVSPKTMNCLGQFHNKGFMILVSKRKSPILILPEIGLLAQIHHFSLFMTRAFLLIQISITGYIHSKKSCR